MLFNSLTYLVFMLICVPPVVFGPWWLRRGVLLVGSLTFYAFLRIDFTFLMLFTASLDYLAGRGMGAIERPAARRALLAMTLTINLALLSFFKYAYFAVGSTERLAGALGVPFHLTLPTIILPLGISFYTFQSMSYAIDVYRRVERPIRSYFLYLNYVTFWPQLVAGPILRAHDLLPRLIDYRRPDAASVLMGLEEILQGLFKKLVLAETIADVVNDGFAQPAGQFGALDVWTLCFAFGLQVYFDFAGYSQIAIGSARVMGFDLPKNFDWPYLADSPREFWQRWHISLSTWIRDYLYIPLSGAAFRRTPGAPREQPTFARSTFALFTTWFIMGLWHGANWTFAIWGLWHAALVLGYRLTERPRRAVPAAIRPALGWLVTMPLVMLGWLFFRVDAVSTGMTMLARAFRLGSLRTMSLPVNSYLLTFAYFAGLTLFAGLVRVGRSGRLPVVVPIAFRGMLNGAMLLGVFLLLRSSKSFIYFQF